MMTPLTLVTLKTVAGIRASFVYQLNRYRLLLQYGCLPGAHCEIRHPEKIRIGAQVHIGSHVILNGATEGDIGLDVGAHSRILPFSVLSAHGGMVRLGQHCTVNYGAVLYGKGGLVVGDGVRIAAHSVFAPMNHNYEDPSVPIFLQGESAKGITIEDDVWVGAGAKILDGITIGKGSIIGAGAVVREDVPPFVVAVGVPARIVKYRGGCSQSKSEVPSA
jgi:acetyltransferase-like isoleucine patch superfamily enzyme